MLNSPQLQVIKLTLQNLSILHQNPITKSLLIATKGSETFGNLYYLNIGGIMWAMGGWSSTLVRCSVIVQWAMVSVRLTLWPSRIMMAS